MKDILDRYRGMPQFESVGLSRPDEMGMDDETPFHFACRNGLIEDVKAMLEFPGLDINVRGDIGCTALHEAVSGKWQDVVGLLISKGANKYIKNDYGETAMDYAALSDVDSIKEMLGVNQGCQ